MGLVKILSALIVAATAHIMTVGLKRPAHELG
jgi:hypothetical protein